MNYRVAIGIVVGFLSWWVGLFITGYTAVFTIPGLRESVRPAIYDDNWSLLSTPMFIGAIVMYCFLNPFSGWLTALITKNATHALLTAVPLTLYAVTAHWFRLWNILPDWYNILVVVMIPPLVYLGGTLAVSRSKDPSSLVAENDS